MKNKKFIVLGAALLALASCGGQNQGDKKSHEFVPGEYTYHTWSTSLGDNWNPFTWETNADEGMLGYVSSPFVDMSILDSKEQTYQWVYEMATAVTDVTADHKADLDKYHANYNGEPKNNFVYEIKLNEKAKWQDGTPIKANDYIESAKLMLDPAYKNYRANLYYSGESAVAGGNQYYNGDQEGVYQGKSFNSFEEAAEAAKTKDYYFDVWYFWGAEGYVKVGDTSVECPQYVSINDETVYSATGKNESAEDDAFSGKDIFETYGPAYLSDMGLSEYVDNWGFGKSYDEVVGIYKVDDYTIRYVLENANDINNFLTHLTSTWLVKVDEYKRLSKVDESGLKVSTYGTSKETTFSYGAYILDSFEDGKQAKFVQNPNWYGWNHNVEKDGKTYYMSETNFLVDGKKQQQYQTTSYIINVLTQATAKLQFESGELNDYAPTAAEIKDYVLSPRLLKVDETYTMSLFFDTNVDDLKAMDGEANGNKNSVALSNLDFRKALSLAFDRADWVKTTEGYKPAYSLMNSLYYYNIYEDATSQYRKTPEAMKAICDLYGLTYTDENLERVYNSITGYNLGEAQKFFKQAFTALNEAKLLNGTEVQIKIGWKKGALEDTDYAQVAALNGYIAKAIAGTGFTKVELVAVGNVNDRYGDVGTNGTLAIGYGAWGGAAFYPFRMMNCYCEPSQTSLHEGRCWDPTKETLTITFHDAESGDHTVTETKTYEAWSASLYGAGQYAAASFRTRLEILSTLEKSFLGFYYRIPLATSTACSMLGYQADYYTTEYQIMYGFGGDRLMRYNYTDAEWEAYVNSQNNVINYK